METFTIILDKKEVSFTLDKSRTLADIVGEVLTSLERKKFISIEGSDFVIK